MNKLVKKAIKGDKGAFIEIVQPLERKLYIIAKSKLKNNEDIKDAIQETLYYAYRNITQLREAEKFESWIISILINNCNKFYKNNYNNYHISLDDSQLNKGDDNQYIKIEYKIDFFMLLELLDNIEKEIFTLFYVEEFTINKISDILNINENTIKTKLRRSRQKIQSYVERWGEDEA